MNSKDNQSATPSAKQIALPVSLRDLPLIDLLTFDVNTATPEQLVEVRKGLQNFGASAVNRRVQTKKESDQLEGKFSDAAAAFL